MQAAIVTTTARRVSSRWRKPMDMVGKMCRSITSQPTSNTVMEHKTARRMRRREGLEAMFFFQKPIGLRFVHRPGGREKVLSCAFFLGHPGGSSSWEESGEAAACLPCGLIETSWSLFKVYLPPGGSVKRSRTPGEVRERTDDSLSSLIGEIAILVPLGVQGFGRKSAFERPLHLQDRSFKLLKLPKLRCQSSSVIPIEIWILP